MARPLSPAIIALAALTGCSLEDPHPHQSKAAHIGISLSGTGEAPHCPVFVDGQPFAKLRGTYDELAEQFTWR